jgi:Sulfatase-modifying factor enzyme 1/KAP family P-loop domain
LYHGVTHKANGMAENNNSDDLLGYGDYADSLWRRIENAVYKDFDNAKGVGDDPLVIGIFGEWGSGKSKLLELILSRAKRKLADQKKLRRLDAGFMLTIPVFFQPWKYEHEEHLHIPLLMHIFDALKEAIKTGQSPTDYWTQTFAELADKYKTQVPASVKLFEKLLVDSIGVGADVSMPGATKLGLKAANSLSGLLPKLSKPKSNLAEKYKFSGDGHYYRQIHKALKAVTRPNQADNREILQGIRTTCNPRINFVIFIDDLDRCLPENAVAALELIKTIFNVESFAFVLALDDEIIERGIGHRYKEYKLQDKKPEMPITGFEYLEKIIHLPFRLPAITRPQARSFVQKHEQSIEKDASLRWFDDLPAPGITGQIKKSSNPEADMSDLPLPEFLANSPRAQTRVDFLELALSGFDAFVPRKLIRLIELLHQIAKIAKLKGKPINFAANAAIDARIVLCLALIQLFQPELFRILRRRTDSFPFLMTAFSRVLRIGASKSDEPKFKDAKLSDIDLWQWAVDASVPGKAPPWALKETESIHSYIAKVVAEVHAKNQSAGADAQQVRLPLAAQLVEHRAVQRHVFDVLKLVKKIVSSMEDMATRSSMPPYAVTFADYLSLLVGEINVGDSIAVHASSTINPVTEADITRRFALSSVSSLAADLLSEDQSVQANLAARNELLEGQFIDQKSMQLLSLKLLRYIQPLKLAEQIKSDKSVGKNKELHIAELRLLNGLQYLWPYIALGEGKTLWDLVAQAINPYDHQKTIEPKIRALWYDVRSALGQDSRFEGIYALAQRIQTDADEAPPGFVKIPDESFYVCRYPVTVAQYSVFRESDAFKELIKTRPHEIRVETPEWSTQLLNKYRPVVNLNWFECTAYAKWLQIHYASGELNKFGSLKGYLIRLPVETEWEIAARGGLKGKDFPWGNDDKDIHQRANVDQQIGHSTTVGCYPANNFGLFDMAGNVWEWQNNLYEKTGRSMSLRGGSWYRHPTIAYCSSRDGDPPDDWYDCIGFRLVLSLADL